jgi:hypothetical protein
MDNHQRSTWVDLLESEYQGKDKDEQYYIKLDIARELDAKLRMNDILFDDTKRAMQEATVQPGDQFKYRTLVRTLFAHIEGQLSGIKQIVLRWYRLRAITLTDEELGKLVDESTTFGELKVAPIRQPLKENLKFSFKMLGLTPGRTPVNIDTNSPGWRAFCASIDIRDDLIHPKVEQDLVIAEPGMRQVMHAWKWFQEVSSQASNSVPFDPEVWKSEHPL